MKLKLLFTISLLFVINSLFAQSARYIISGVVRDMDTKETLPFANVFLTGTTYGTTTNEDGAFEFKVFEPGSYELVVRFVGFDTYVRAITFTAPEALAFDIQLKPQSVNLGSVEVTDRLDEEWQRSLESFKRDFLGLSSNATKCEILNEEEINFYFNKKERTLQAFCDGPIKIRNTALGYDIDYYLESFIADFKKGFVTYYGFTQFSDSKAGNSAKKRFLKRRFEAYHGSREHFFKALYNDELDMEGYEVMIAKDVKGFGRVTTGQNVNLFDSLEIIENPLSKALGFSDYVYITYRNEKEAEEYVGMNAPQYQKSWISLIDSESPIVFESNGYIINPISFYANGYWSFEKVGDMLPTNYKPPQQ